MKSRPSFQFYPGDWIRDSVSGCSLAAQGLWLRMMILAHDSERYGYLSLNSNPMPPEHIAARCGIPLDTYLVFLAELDRAGVPSRTPDGIIFSRRMVRDERERKGNRERQLKYYYSNNKPNKKLTPTYEDEVEDEEIGLDCLSDTECSYCGITEKQSGRPFQREHFIPRSAGGTEIVMSCVRCNEAKQASVFQNVEDCKTWLHWRFWASNRARYVKHRKFAFSGVAPTLEIIKKAKEINETLGRPSYYTTKSPANAIEKERFDRPTTGDCEMYCSKIGLPVSQAAQFINYYESRGWKVGNTPMKNWQAAMRNWKIRWEERRGNINGHQTAAERDLERVLKGI